MSHLKLFMNKGSVSVQCSSWLEYVLNKQNSFYIICLIPCIMAFISILKTVCSAFKKKLKALFPPTLARRKLTVLQSTVILSEMSLTT